MDNRRWYTTISFVGLFGLASVAHAQVVSTGGVSLQIGSAPGSGQPPATTAGVNPPGGPPRDVAPAAGRSRVQGRIFDASSRRPLRRARVVISGAALRGARTTNTDPNGAYEFTDLPAGSYSVTASRPGYVPLGYKQTRPNAPSGQLVVADNQSYERIDIALPIGGVIAGRVVDEFGEPVVDATVVALRQQYVNGVRRPTQTGPPERTNDIGEFRVYGLAPGEYVLSASVRSVVSPTERLTDRSGYATTYYPSTSDPQAAQRLSIAPGDTLANVVVMLEPAVLARVSGMVLDDQNQPVRSGSIMAFPVSGRGNVSVVPGIIGPGGTFTIEGVPPGRYLLRVTPMGGFVRPDAVASVGTATVSVAGADLTNVVVAPAPPIVVRGRLSGSPETLTQLQAGSVRIGASPVAFSPFAPPQAAPTPAAPDLSFELRLSPGEFLIRPVGPPDIVVRAIRLNGSDISRGLKVSAGDSIEGLEVEVVKSTSKVTVVVTNRRGEPTNGRDVVVFPNDEQAWGVLLPGHSALGRTGEQGTYQTSALLPGTYYVATPDDFELGRNADPDYLATLRGSAQRVTIAEGEIATVQLLIRER